MMIYARFEVTVSVPMTHWFGNHHLINKDRDMDRHGQQHAHSLQEHLYHFKNKSKENNVFLNTRWATLFENQNTLDHIWRWRYLKYMKMCSLRVTF